MFVFFYSLYLLNINLLCYSDILLISVFSGEGRTQDRWNHQFGKVRDGEMVLTDAGQIAADEWMVIPNHYPNITLDSWVVMPNHHAHWGNHPRRGNS